MSMEKLNPQRRSSLCPSALLLPCADLDLRNSASFRPSAVGLRSLSRHALRNFGSPQLGGRPLPLLVADLLCLWLHGGELPQCLYPSAAVRSKCRVAAFALSALQVLHPLVPECAAGHLAVSPGEMQKLWRAYLRPVFPGRALDCAYASWSAGSGSGRSLLGSRWSTRSFWRV